MTLDEILLRRATADQDPARDGGSGPEHALASGRTERRLLGGDLSRGLEQPRRWRRTPEEVGLDLSDYAAAELHVTVADALIRRRGLTAGDARGDVICDHSRGSLGEHPGL